MKQDTFAYIYKNGNDEMGYYGKRLGVVAAAMINDKYFSVGISMCKKGDKFNKIVGQRIAIGRAKTDKIGNFNFADKKRLAQINKFINSAKRYFKGCDINPLTADRIIEMVVVKPTTPKTAVETAEKLIY